MADLHLIEVHADGRTMHLGNRFFSYAMHVVDGRFLAHIYWGAPLGAGAPLEPDTLMYLAAPPYLAAIPRGDAPTAGNWRWAAERVSLDTLPQEYPVWGTGDQRDGALEAILPDGTAALRLEYRSHEVISGVVQPPDLPLLRSDHDLGAAETLRITLADPRGDLTIDLHYVILADSPALFRWVLLHRPPASGSDGASDGPVTVTRLATASVDLPTDHRDMVTLAGSWARERHPVRIPLRSGTHTVGTRAGASSHQTSPFLAVCDPEADEHHGAVHAMSLLYSGNFRAGAAVDQYGRCRVSIGLDGFHGVLAPGESVASPAAALVHSDAGFNGLSERFHRVLRAGIVPSRWRREPRKTVINSWEAMYFDLDADRVASLARAGREIGAELLVLDDGWFSRRRDDTTSLGDWWVNRELFPEGLAPVAEQVRREGLEFGIWIEPEMVSPESELYRAHPEWVLQVARREPTRARNQLTLDLSNPAVVDHLFETVGGILQESGARYVKWDMNRQMTEAGSPALPARRQGEVMHRYILGLYRLLERLTAAFPDVLFEGCAGGGGRMDLGLAHWSPRFWTSDQTDAIERLDIQYGTSIVFPPEMMGAHVSAVPNHQVGRVTPAWTRVLTAVGFSYGYELNPPAESAADRAVFADGSALYRRVREVARTGRLLRLGSPSGAGGAIAPVGGTAPRTALGGSDGGGRAWMLVAADGSEAYVFSVRPLARTNTDAGALRLTGLARAVAAGDPAPSARTAGSGDPRRVVFRDTDTGQRYTVAQLETRGLRLEGDGDYQGRYWHLVREGQERTDG